MRPDADSEPGFAGPGFAAPVANPGPSAGVDHKTTDASVESLPMAVTPDETLRRNTELWPVAVQDHARGK